VGVSRTTSSVETPTHDHHVCCQQVAPLCRPSWLRRVNTNAIGFFRSGHPLDDYAKRAEKLRAKSWSELLARVTTATTAGKVAQPWSSSRSGETKPATRWAIGSCRPTGHFEGRAVFGRVPSIATC